MALTWNRARGGGHGGLRRGPRAALQVRQPAQPARGLRGQPQRRAAARAPEQAVALDLQDPERMREFERSSARGSSRPDGPRRAEYVYTCGAGATSFTVDPYGHLQMCQLSRGARSTCAASASSAGWNELLPGAARAQVAVALGLPDAATCCRCAGAARARPRWRRATSRRVVPQFCEIAHLRAFTVTGRVPGHRRDATCCLGAARSRACSQTSGGAATARPEASAPPMIQLLRVARR